ncbi:NUDIX hydrolase [Corynebacterium sp. sy017]|uniref:NUDIX hydrolase n=1 Tax=unclassified Corynebacterium TaxID=2624378 RepID=UPI0011867C49|nr:MULTISPECIES: NUDIX hydrolase [unclassified Corynebacterium]MBP3089028.1 NUDIX hydrolase [Corynebacterium sp. sy017]QDZ42394.1 NUDIX hydrolase [Corynebacterium sp. sy039]TSD91349.1 NUDIX hydrolase [Corynebacterium sp. SY003]
MPPIVEGLGGRKLAVTVLILRDTAAGLEVFVQERVSSMPTFPNTTVFPGGGVDPRDLEEPMDQVHNTWGGPDLDFWSQSLKVDKRMARGLVCGAARELFEETGTLLAGHVGGAPVQDATPYHPQRLALESHRLSLSQVLARNQLVLRTDLLYPFARWVSAPTDEHQFDVYSFLATAPDGQEPDGNTREAASTGWFTPDLILDGWRAGLLQLVIPTWAQLLHLSHFHSVEEAFEAAKEIDIAPVIGDPVDDPRYYEFFHVKPPKRF